MVPIPGTKRIQYFEENVGAPKHPSFAEGSPLDRRNPPASQNRGLLHLERARLK